MFSSSFSFRVHDRVVRAGEAKLRGRMSEVIRLSLGLLGARNVVSCRVSLGFLGASFVHRRVGFMRVRFKNRCVFEHLCVNVGQKLEV